VAEEGFPNGDRALRRCVLWSRRGHAARVLQIWRVGAAPRSRRLANPAIWRSS
jgi:hypothetical protein